MFINFYTLIKLCDKSHNEYNHFTIKKVDSDEIIHLSQKEVCDILNAYAESVNIGIKYDHHFELDSSNNSLNTNSNDNYNPIYSDFYLAFIVNFTKYRTDETYQLILYLKNTFITLDIYNELFNSGNTFLPGHKIFYSLFASVNMYCKNNIFTSKRFTSAAIKYKIKKNEEYTASVYNGENQFEYKEKPIADLIDIINELNSVEHKTNQTIANNLINEEIEYFTP